MVPEWWEYIIEGMHGKKKPILWLSQKAKGPYLVLLTENRENNWK